MTRRPDVSIVVCTYNRAASLRLTLDALDAQVTPPDLAWELLVVDNNSSDATQREIGDFAARARIRVRSLFVRRQGLSHARNAGVAGSHGAIVAFTDDDVHPPPDWIARITNALDESRADIVGGRIRPRWQQPPPPWLEHRAFFHSALAIMDHAMPSEVLDPYRVPSVWGANMAFRRGVFDKVGLFDSRLGLIGRTLYRGEEIDLVKRAVAAGYRAVYDPRVVVWHRIGADRMRIAYLSRLHFQRAEGEALLGERAPAARLRSIARALYRWLKAVALQQPDRAERWLTWCAALGVVSGVCKRRFRSKSAGR